MSSGGQRDYRLDFFRGLALFAIFIDHIPNNPVGNFTLRAFALSDAAEVFIFISGYTAALVYGRRMLRDGPLFASALILRRAWQLYLAHLTLFLLYAAQVAYTVRRFDNPLFSDELGIGDFLTEPDRTILHVLLLRFQPALLDILPLYIALLAVFPLFMLAMRVHLLLALVPSFAIYVLAQVTEVNLPGQTAADHWFFNPFGWQFLFVIAGCLGFMQAQGERLTPLLGRWRPLLLWGSAAVVAAGCAIQVSWSLHLWNPRIPGILFETLGPIHKTLLPPIRLVSILAMAALVGLLVRRDAPFMTSRWGWPVVLCGQNSLQVFCLGILLSLLGNIVLTFVSKTWLVLAAVNLGGVAIMIGLGYLAAWFDGGGRLPARPARAAAVARGLALLVPALLLAAPAAHAAPACPVPESLALRDLALPATRKAVARGELTVLMLGGAAMAGKAAGNDAMTLPARLEARLGAALPGVRVRVVNAGVPRATADSGAQRMALAVRESGARLVIWAPGAREAVLGLDVEPYVAALQQGITAVQEAGADLILLDMQYAPSITRIANLAPFRAALAGTASAHELALLPRYDLMMRWNDDGVLDLDVQDSGQRRKVAQELFDCLAQALAGPVAAAVR